MYTTAIGTFKKLQSEITELTRTLMSIGQSVDFIDYLCRKFSIDREFYALWMGNMNDFAELVVLYLNQETREGIRQELMQLKEIC